MDKEISCRHCSKQAVWDGLCHDHTKLYWHERWHYDNGWESIKLFGFECLPHLTNPAYGSCSFHDRAYKNFHYAFTQSENKLDALFALFGHREIAKTTLITVGAVYAIAFDLKKFIVYRGDSFGNAKKNFMNRFKSSLQKDKFLYVFGDLKPTRYDTGYKDTEGLVILKNKSRSLVVCMGLEQSTLSSVNEDGRIDMLFVDDIENKDNTKTVESVQYLREKLKGEDIPALDTPKGCLFANLTPKVVNGLYQEIKANSSFKVNEAPLWKVDSNGEYILDPIDGRRIPEWEERYSKDYCERLEAFYSDTSENRKMFAREYLLKTSTIDTKSIPEECIQFCVVKKKYEAGKNYIQITEVNGEPVSQPKWEAAYITFAIDPATSEEGKSCDSAGVVMATLSDCRRIVLDYFVGKYRCRDILKNPKAQGTYDIELDLSNIEKKGVVGEMYRFAGHWTPDKVIVETVLEYMNTIREMQNSYQHWYTHRYPHRFGWQSDNARGRNSKKRDEIYTVISTEAEYKRFFISGSKKTGLDENGVFKKVIPMEPLYNQLVDMEETHKIDIADALSKAIKYAVVPNADIYTEESRVKEMEDREQVKKIDPIVYMHRGFFKRKRLGQLT
jgi:hypothetical protein